ncbi:radical SAM protein [Candidatus Woesearchaeota archaeon]|nr:radical SAM protein [Candidatus Woesearchaeota archaeon]
MEDFKIRGPYWLVYFPTDSCNYKCKHCYLENIPEKDEMDYEEVMRIFSNSSLLKNTRIGISGGEPFTKRDIVDILTGLSKMGYKLEITTNGAFPEKIGDFLMNSNTTKVDIAISIDGLKDINDEIRTKGGFNKAIESIKIIKDIGVNLLQVNTVIQKLNINQLEEIKQYFSSFVDHHFFIPLLSTRNNRVDYTDKEIEKILEYMHYKFDIKYLITKGEFRIKDCHSGQTTCFIDPTGKVFTCMTGQRYFFPRKNYFMGDLRKINYSFDDLWISKQAEIARKDVKKCEGCYNACEVHREKSWHGLDDNIDWEIISKKW